VTYLPHLRTVSSVFDRVISTITFISCFPLFIVDILHSCTTPTCRVSTRDLSRHIEIRLELLSTPLTARLRLLPFIPHFRPLHSISYTLYPSTHSDSLRFVSRASTTCRHCFDIVATRSTTKLRSLCFFLILFTYISAFSIPRTLAPPHTNPFVTDIVP